MVTFSRPVMAGSTAAYWPARPMTRRTCSGRRRASMPATRSSPPSGRTSVATERTNVVLPAPLGPSTATTWPLSATRSSPFSACTLPKLRVRPWASTIGVLMSPSPSNRNGMFCSDFNGTDRSIQGFSGSERSVHVEWDHDSDLSGAAERPQGPGGPQRRDDPGGRPGGGPGGPRRAGVRRRPRGGRGHERAVPPLSQQGGPDPAPVHDRAPDLHRPRRGLPRRRRRPLGGLRHLHAPGGRGQHSRPDAAPGRHLHPRRDAEPDVRVRRHPQRPAVRAHPGRRRDPRRRRRGRPGADLRADSGHRLWRLARAHRPAAPAESGPDAGGPAGRSSHPRAARAHRDRRGVRGPLDPPDLTADRIKSAIAYFPTCSGHLEVASGARRTGGGVVAADVIHLQVVAAGDAPDDDEAIAESALALGHELAELDVDEVQPVAAGEAPEGAKGIELLALGGLLIKLGQSSRVLREVVDAVRDWVGRTGSRSVKLTVDGDVLEVTGASSADVKQLIDAWVQRHSEP